MIFDIRVVIQFSSSDLIYAVDLTGTFVFAVSGWLLASRKELDFFGATVISFITAVGGGTLRDLLIGSAPVGWMEDMNYLYAIAAGIFATAFFKRVFEKLRKTMFLFDSIGIGLFAILGLEKTLATGLSPIVAVMMGTISAVFGGVLRDTLVNEIPLIFRKEIYATICIGGGLLYLLLKEFGLNQDWNVVITISSIISVRILAVVYNWTFKAVK